ncbi:CD4-1 molecule isoform X2 [Betta splendens]|uniref:CD4-1 molecule isoform X2 n=1 Tax=Betta splendens TaxID=158456 RepID=A0A9W2XBR1_BETSP|nr:CD4-1 molecule isoform X2 [Betta splendens]
MKNLIHSVVFLITVLCSMTVLGAYEEVVYAQVGQTVHLKPENGQIKPYMYWNWNGIELVHRNSLTGWATPNEKWKNRVTGTDNGLSITNLEEGDFGTWTLAVLTDKTHEKSTIYTCHLFRITVSMKSVPPLLAGEPLTLDCNTATPPKNKNPEIYWVDPQGEEQRGRQVSIPKATSQHSGQWTCFVKNHHKESGAIISVAVVDLAPGPSSYQFTSKSSGLTIPCSLPSHVTWDQLKEKGLEEVQWLFSPKPPGDLSNGPKLKLYSLSLETLQWEAVQPRELDAGTDVSKGDLSLSKRKGKEKDAGDYECMMKFKTLTLKTSVHVEVLRIIAAPGTNLTSGQQLNMTCSVGAALPSDMQLKLLPPVESLSHLQQNSDHSSTNVILPAVSTAHSGRWRCELWQGGKKLTSEVITLKIEYKLSVWMLVVICSVVVIVLLLLILVFIFYRRRQQRMRHPGHQLCRCNHPKPKGFYKT